jgi:MFS family permease
VLPVGVTALFFHQVALFREAGIANALVPLAFATYAGANAGATAASGRVVDAWSPRAMGVLSIGCFFAAVAILVAGPATWVTVVGYAALLGTGSATANLAGSLVWPTLFGDVGVGRVRGVAGGLRNCFTAGGPLLVTFGAGQTVIGATAPLLIVGVCGLMATRWLPDRGTTRTAGTSTRGPLALRGWATWLSVRVRRKPSAES